MDEKMSAKMVKCLLELKYHTYAVAMSQAQQQQQQQQQIGEPGTPNATSAGGSNSSSNTDYTVSFKNLEERQSNDAMDGLYK